MHGVFDDEDELQPVEQRRDTELTLGPVLLLVLFFGLVLLCGLCFGLGYSMGSHGSKAFAPSAQQPDLSASLQTSASQLKPPAAQQSGSQPQSAVDGLPPPEASGGVLADASQSPASSSATGANSAQPVVKPALLATAAAPTPAPGQPATALAAALESPLMVQIAAVSHQEDADVLVAALRKRGYAVAVSRDPADSQFHVRLGPFANRNDANATRRKLLNDGYNAIVQP